MILLTDPSGFVISAILALRIAITIVNTMAPQVRTFETKRLRSFLCESLIKKDFTIPNASTHVDPVSEIIILSWYVKTEMWTIKIAQSLYHVTRFLQNCQKSLNTGCAEKKNTTTVL